MNTSPRATALHVEREDRVEIRLTTSMAISKGDHTGRGHQQFDRSSCLRARAAGAFDIGRFGGVAADRHEPGHSAAVCFRPAS